jgi:hypothetical protein
MSLFERGPRDGGQSDPSTSRSLRKLQEDPVRLASLLAGANSVVPRRRRRAGFLTASGTTILLLLSAVEAPNLFAAVGLTGDQHVSAEQRPDITHGATTAGTSHATQSWAATPGATTPSKVGASTKAAPKTPPPTLARTVQPSVMLARISASGTPTPTPTPTATATTHGKAKGHGKSGTGGGTAPNHH